MIVFSTPSPKQCTTKETEMDDYVIRNVGIKLCKLKCSENGQCLSIEYDIETQSDPMVPLSFELWTFFLKGMRNSKRYEIRRNLVL